MYIDDSKLFAKNEEELDSNTTVRIYSENKGMQISRGKCALLIMRSEKRQMTERIEVPNQEKIRMLGEK